MKILRIPRVPISVIQEIVDSAQGTPVKLVEWPAGEELSSNVLVQVDEEGHSACLTISSPKKGGGIPTLEELKEYLQADGVIHGVDEETLKRLSVDPPFDVSECVATYTEPVHGVAQDVEYSFETNVGKPFLVDKSGRINLKELKFIQQVHEGDVVAKYIPAIAPVDGRTVRGELLPARPIAATKTVRPGKNTELCSDESEIRSCIDGNAFVKSGAVHVEPIVAVEAVDYKTGNISFEGTVRVKRGVADGFVVHAGGTLEIGESVGRATISAGRDLILKAGGNGADEGVFECEGDLYAKYIESATVRCRGNCFISDAIMHSAVHVRGNLGLRGKHAGIIGGAVLVGGNVWCKKIGSISETPTHISAGVEPRKLVEYEDLKESLEALNDKVDDLDRIIRHIEGKLKTAEELTDTEALKKARAEREISTLELEKAESSLRRMRESITASARIRVVVEEQLHPRVTINFGRVEFHTTEAGTDRTILKCIDGKVIESGFNAAEPPDFEALIGGGETQK